VAPVTAIRCVLSRVIQPIGIVFGGYLSNYSWLQWSAMELDIDQSWDGVALGGDEAARVVLTAVDGGLQCVIDAPFHGDPPPSGPPGSFWELWEHEVVELFVVGEGDPIPYTEIEVGPHGHYLVLRLRGVRNVVERSLPLAVHWERAGERWSATLRIPSEYLPSGQLLVNAYAIHGQGEQRRYLVCTPLGGSQPDFHRVDGFTRRLPFSVS
jgi:hypothetical protein